ncbi:conserved hypothetical protein [Perkinsus marinus ATCC 50983]|uniref:Chromatin modification-related protein EAF6 n=1 Tax=Perkinsus marinus (strain ATCC 50983 / TXsc) TaxID=423536 RepID=C5KYD5_PERM5|nr:conserved hypothetical protein [Perkinsus marinus ATCC 50983]EER10512.1 conserved hypothetical protein [Perkinsus marinus ATCC 50983]|eukprot:XP_002778717.1 conserved hypothetical protein [Perkinsus marinus ATCC 50983]
MSSAPPLGQLSSAIKDRLPPSLLRGYTQCRNNLLKNLRSVELEIAEKEYRYLDGSVDYGNYVKGFENLLSYRLPSQGGGHSSRKHRGVKSADRLLSLSSTSAPLTSDQTSAAISATPSTPGTPEDESTISEPIHVSKKSRTQKGAAANMKHSVVSEESGVSSEAQTTTAGTPPIASKKIGKSSSRKRKR